MMAMRILVVSDTHGRQSELIDAMDKMEKPDIILHLGDNIEDGEQLSKIFGVETHIVRGNGDYDHNYPYDKLVELGGKNIFMTHGHRWNVKMGFVSLYYRGLELGADLILYGHTHVPINIVEKGILIMNPGSPSLPRQAERIKTFGLIEIENNQIKTDIIKLP